MTRRVDDEIKRKQEYDLCYSSFPHGDTATAARSGPRPTLLSQLRGRSHRPTDLWGLFRSDLPPLRNGTRIPGRTRNWIMEPAPVLTPVEPERNPTDSKPTLVRGLSLLDSVLLLVSGIIGSSIFLTAKDIATPLPQPAD